MQVRFPASEGAAAYADLLPERDEIDQEFADQGLPAPEWRDGEVPLLSLKTGSPLPWTVETEAEQRAWLGRAANQFVNSLRPRLQRAV